MKEREHDEGGMSIPASINSLERRVSNWMRGMGAWANRFQPGVFQKKAIWMALTLTSVAMIGLLLVGLLLLLVWTIGQLQPVLVPLAAAAVLAYILDPVVAWICRKFRMSRRGGASLVVLLLVLAMAGLLTLVIVPAVGEAVDLFQRKDELQSRLLEIWESVKSSLNVQIREITKDQQSTDWVAEWLGNKANLGGILSYVGTWISHRAAMIPGLLIWFVFPVVIPFFLWYMLAHRDSISVHWHEWLPIRASKFKTEIIDTLTSIHQQLSPYFRGQMTVSLINATLTTGLLLILGLDYALLLGCFMIFLGLLPMIGVVMCALPAMLIAFFQFADPQEQARWGITAVWVYPLIVLGIFVLVQQIDGWFITPRVIGESTGLSDFQVILSIFFWSTVLGGFLGALLAVPLTSCVKVLHKRYVREMNRETEKEMAKELEAGPDEPDHDALNA